MRFATIKRKGSDDTYESTMDYFSLKYFGDYVLGEEFFVSFGKYLDGTKFPCEKMVLDPYCGYSDRFRISFYYNSERVCYYMFSINENKGGILGIYSSSYVSVEVEKMFSSIIRGYVNEYNGKIFSSQMEKCGIVGSGEDVSVRVVVDEYVDYKKEREVVLEGKLSEVFDEYVTYNDRMRYCNGDYWKFADKNVGLLYSMFIEKYDGNYFLDNAVRRGCIID